MSHHLVMASRQTVSISSLLESHMTMQVVVSWPEQEMSAGS